MGSVKGSVYWAYIKAWGAIFLPLSLIAAAFFERGVAVAQNFWLKVGNMLVPAEICADLLDMQLFFPRFRMLFQCPYGA